MSGLSRSESDTESFGRALAAELAPDGTLLLDGDLGAGKTVLVRGLAAGLGIDRAEVRSPTFTLMNEYGPRGELLHVDLYRVAGDEILALGLEERLAGPGVKVVEWAERLPFPVVAAAAVRVEVLASGERRLIRDG